MANLSLKAIPEAYFPDSAVKPEFGDVKKYWL